MMAYRIDSSYASSSRRFSDMQDESTASAIKDSLTTSLLCTIHELENWQRDNEFLLGNYRRVSNSYKSCIASLGYLHNQTGNVYSHLLGAGLFLSWAVKTYNDLSKRYPTSNAYDILAFGIFIAGALICFGFSATFHILGNHSRHVYDNWFLLDLYGIFVLIVGIVYSGTYYAFYCEPGWWQVYSIGITAITTTAAVFVGNPRFRTPKWRRVRAILFVAIGWSGAIPMTHAVQKWGRAQVDAQMGWDLLFLEGLCYITGALIYATRIPERWRPGAFDIWGSSHQIFHLFALFGAILHMHAIIRAFDYNHNPATRRCYI